MAIPRLNREMKFSWGGEGVEGPQLAHPWVTPSLRRGRCCPRSRVRLQLAPMLLLFVPIFSEEGRKVAAVSTLSLRFQVRNPGRSQVCRRKVGERLQNLAALGRLFLAGFGATFRTFRCLVPTSHGPALQLGWRRGKGKTPLAAPAGPDPAPLRRRWGR